MHHQVAHVELTATVEDLTRVVAEKQNVEPWRVLFFRDGVPVDVFSPLSISDLGDGKGVEVRICNSAVLVSLQADPDGKAGMLLVNLETKEIWRRYDISSPVVCSVVSPATLSSRTCMYCGSVDGSLRKFDLSVTHPVMHIKHPFAVTAIAVAERTRFIFTGSEDGLVRKFSSRSGLCKLKFEPNANEEVVSAIAVSPCERHIYVACADMIIRKYDALNGGCATSYGSSSLRISRICVSFCGLFIYSASDHEVNVFDMETSVLINSDDQFQIDSTVPIAAWELSSDSGFLYLAVGSRVLKFDAEDGKLLYSVEPHTANISSLAVSSNGDLVTTTAIDGILSVLQADTGESQTVFQHELIGHCHLIP